MQVLNTQRHATDTDRDGGVEAPECAVPVVCVSFCLGWGGFGTQESGTFHGVIGACLAISIISTYGGMAGTLTISCCFL